MILPAALEMLKISIGLLGVQYLASATVASGSALRWPYNGSLNESIIATD